MVCFLCDEFIDPVSQILERNILLILGTFVYLNFFIEIAFAITLACLIIQVLVLKRFDRLKLSFAFAFVLTEEPNTIG